VQAPFSLFSLRPHSFADFVAQSAREQADALKVGVVGDACVFLSAGFCDHALQIQAAKSSAKAAADKDAQVAANAQKAKEAAETAANAKAAADEKQRVAKEKLEAAAKADAKAAKTADAITVKKNEADKKLRVAQQSAQLAQASLTTATVLFTIR
jgi:hypothetical protein